MPNQTILLLNDQIEAAEEELDTIEEHIAALGTDYAQTAVLRQIQQEYALLIASLQVAALTLE